MTTVGQDHRGSKLGEARLPPHPCPSYYHSGVPAAPEPAMPASDEATTMDVSQ